MMKSCPWPNSPETFDEREEVKDHLSSVHLDYYPYRCGRCRVMFPSRIQVSCHWTAEHEAAGPVSVACCISRTKEQRLKTLLSCEEIVNGSQHTITVTATANPTSSTPIDLNRIFCSRPSTDRAINVRDKEDSAFDKSLAIGEQEGTEQGPDIIECSGAIASDTIAAATIPSVTSTNSSSSPSSPSSPHISNQSQLPAELIERILDLTANRPQLVDAPVEQRFRYFASQLAIAIPNVPLIDIQSSFTCSQKPTLSETLQAQRWPGVAILEAALQEYKAFLPSNEAELLPIVRSCIAHARKIVNQHICRERELLSESIIPSTVAKKCRLEARFAIE